MMIQITIFQDNIFQASNEEAIDPGSIVEQGKNSCEEEIVPGSIFEQGNNA
jgi:hypothetical protein